MLNKLSIKFNYKTGFTTNTTTKKYFKLVKISIFFATFLSVLHMKQRNNYNRYTNKINNNTCIHKSNFKNYIKMIKIQTFSLRARSMKRTPINRRRIINNIFINHSLFTPAL